MFCKNVDFGKNYAYFAILFKDFAIVVLFRCNSLYIMSMDDLPEKIDLPYIRFESQTTDYILALEELRGKTLRGDTPPVWFFQLKNAFMVMESFLSSRIEGNHTTIAEYAVKVTMRESDNKSEEEDILEIENIEAGISFIEEAYKDNHDFPIDEAFVLKLHSLVVQDLTHEGDKTDGYRNVHVQIQNSKHEPPGPESVQGNMNFLFEFINRETSSKYDLVKIAVAHHRFVWIHPFVNGNGRTARLLTYAMLLKTFAFNSSRIINPTAIFCSDRQKYYEMLSVADSLENDSVCKWCDYMLDGLLQELKKVDNLTNAEYVRNKVLLPMIDLGLYNKQITEEAYNVLKVAIQKPEIQASDVAPLFNNKYETSRKIRSFIEAKYLMPVTEGSRKYCINLRSPLFGTLFQILEREGFFKE